jgi:hypothetical protein
MVTRLVFYLSLPYRPVVVGEVVVHLRAAVADQVQPLGLHDGWCRRQRVAAHKGNQESFNLMQRFKGL